MLPPLPCPPSSCLRSRLTGCKADFAQNDDVEPQEADVRAGLVELYTLDDETPDVVAEGGCFADALLARLSLDELVQAGVVEDDGSVTVAIPMLDVDVAESWVDAQAACVDYVVPSTRALVDHGAVGLDETAYAACFEAALSRRAGAHRAGEDAQRRHRRLRRRRPHHRRGRLRRAAAR